MYKAGAPYPAEQNYPQHQGGYAQYPQGTVYPEAPPPGFQPSAPPPGFQTSAPPPGFQTSSAYPPNQSYPIGGAYPGSTYPGQEFSYVGGNSQLPPPYESHLTTNVDYEGLDDSMGKWEGFSDKAIRRSFIRKMSPHKNKKRIFKNAKIRKSVKKNENKSCTCLEPNTSTKCQKCRLPVQSKSCAVWCNFPSDSSPSENIEDHWYASSRPWGRQHKVYSDISEESVPYPFNNHLLHPPVSSSEHTSSTNKVSPSLVEQSHSSSVE